MSGAAPATGGEPLVVLAPNASMLTGPGTNTYLVGDGELACIDPGPGDASHLEAILEAAAHRGRIARILLTHSHPDHRPLARRLAARTGAVVLAHDVTRGDDGARAIADGEVVAAGARRLRAVHTPGHASDHLCFLDETSGALYTGDHVLSGMTTVIDPPDGDMSAYMSSLERVRALRPTVLHPGHGARVAEAGRLLDDYIAHRREREAQVERAARDRGEAVRAADLVETLYAGYPPGLWPLAARTVRAHLDKLVREGRALRIEDGDEPAYRVG